MTSGSGDRATVVRRAAGIFGAVGKRIVLISSDNPDDNCAVAHRLMEYTGYSPELHALYKDNNVVRIYDKGAGDTVYVEVKRNLNNILGLSAQEQVLLTDIQREVARQADAVVGVFDARKFSSMWDIEPGVIEAARYFNGLRAGASSPVSIVGLVHNLGYNRDGVVDIGGGVHGQYRTGRDLNQLVDQMKSAINGSE